MRSLSRPLLQVFNIQCLTLSSHKITEWVGDPGRVATRGCVALRAIKGVVVLCDGLLNSDITTISPIDSVAALVRAVNG